MTTPESNEGSFGGPTVFLENEEGLWGEYALPEGKRIESGDKISVRDCRFLGVWYRYFDAPFRPKTLEKDSPEYLAWAAETKVYLEMLKREDLKLTFAGGKFLNLIPVEG